MSFTVFPRIRALCDITKSRTEFEKNLTARVRSRGCVGICLSLLLFGLEEGGGVGVGVERVVELFAGWLRSRGEKVHSLMFITWLKDSGHSRQVKNVFFMTR